MSQSKEQGTRANEGRVKVGKLPRQEKELEDREAEKIKGQGAGGGGVIGSRGPAVQIGEEIPQ